LNEAGVRPFGKSAEWQSSSVSNILTTRAVLGEFQPHKMIDGTRRPDGDPIKGYFPAIIDARLFYRAQAGRADRRVSGQGRKGEYVSNLFSRVAKCAYCNSSMAFENKGTGPKGGRFLICDRKKRGLGCSSIRWRYDDFEASFLAFVQELDLHGLVQDHDQVTKRDQLTAEIEILRGQVAETNEFRERTYQLYLLDLGNKEYVADKLKQYASRLTELQTAIKEKEEDLLAQTSELTGFYTSKDQIKSLIGRLQQEKGQEVYKIRAQIASSIRNLVAGIRVAPSGRTVSQALISFSRPHWGLEERAAYKAEIDRHIELAKRRYFVVSFKQGGRRYVFPNVDDPLRYEEQFISKGEDRSGWMKRVGS
jgi:hypothetical protein